MKNDLFRLSENMSSNSNNLPFQLGLSHASCLDDPGLPGADCFPVMLPHAVELHVIRHGESAANAGKLITGTMNVPLTKLGRKQARQAGRRLARNYDLAFSSMLFRSRETLRLALNAGKLNDVCVKESPYLAERRLGNLELQSARPIPEYAGGDLLYAPPGGESYYEVTGRMMRFLTDLAGTIEDAWHRRQKRIRRILLCTHMGPMRILAGILNEDADPVRVLSRSYNPTQMSVFHWCRITYPRFLDIDSNTQI
ncbi:MAG: histidine phosphatase family protein [Syntrophobacteraceae bacterium]